MTLKPITIRIPEGLNDRLGYAAIDHKTTKQAIITEALEAWFEKKKEEEKMEMKNVYPKHAVCTIANHAAYALENSKRPLSDEEARVLYWKSTDGHIYSHSYRLGQDEAQEIVEHYCADCPKKANCPAA